MSLERFRSIAVTGASGFVGGHVAKRLVDSGYHVRCSYRRSEPPAHLLALEERGADLVRADLESANGAESAVRGVDAVIHVAALTSDWGPYEAFERANVVATDNLLDAAIAAGCRKFVFTGSVSVHGFGGHVDSTEAGPYYPLITPYQETKKRAEEHVIARHGTRMATVVVRPGDVYGPGDTTMMFPLLDAIATGMMGHINSGASLTCFVFVEDLVDAFIRALERREADGEIFNITGGERVTWRDVMNTSAMLLGRSEPRLSVPAPIALALATIMEALYRVLRRPVAPALTRYRIRHVAKDFHFDISKARSILGYEPQIRLAEGLRRTVEDYLVRREAAETPR